MELKTMPENPEGGPGTHDMEQKKDDDALAEAGRKREATRMLDEAS
jgi:hypothetical protein